MPVARTSLVISPRKKKIRVIKVPVIAMSPLTARPYASVRLLEFLKMTITKSTANKRSQFITSI